MGLGDEPRILADQLCFPEGPRWDGKRFIFSDVHAHRVLAIDTSGNLTVIAELGDRPSGLGLLPDGSVLVVGMLDRRLWRIEGNGRLSEHADLSSLCSDFINDMVVDQTGRAYVGCRSGKLGASPDSIILVQPDGSCSVAAQGVRSPNGSVITPDGASLIVAETHIGRLTRFTINRDGSLSDRHVYGEVAGYTFDGICLDERGNVWAGAGDKGLVQVGPEGQVLAQRLPWDYHVIACVFGGCRRRHLLVATAAVTTENFQRLGENRELDEESTSRGRLALFEMDVAGAGIP
jgi:sugar lactone lactonase YvrE